MRVVFVVVVSCCRGTVRSFGLHLLAPLEEHENSQARCGRDGVLRSILSMITSDLQADLSSR